MEFNDLYLRYNDLVPATLEEMRILLPCLKTELMLGFNQSNMEGEFNDDMIHIRNIKNVSLSSIRKMLQAVRSLTKNGKPINTPKKIEALENKIGYILISSGLRAEVYNMNYTEEHYNEEERSKNCVVLAPSGEEVKEELLNALEDEPRLEIETANDNVYIKHLPAHIQLPDLANMISDYLADNIDYE